MNTVVVIPSFRPPESLPAFCRTLRDKGLAKIFVINDGSPPTSDRIFSQLKADGIEVISLLKNRGKGGALKAGLEHALAADAGWEHVLFCDDDGQHSPEDVYAVAAEASVHRRHFVMGMRTVGEAMPLKSWIGNTFMSWLVRFRHGLACSDTQSGLRCFSRNICHTLLEVDATRFGFEIVTLLKLHGQGVTPFEVPIQTIYFHRNQDSRFRAIRDSAQVISLTLKLSPRRPQK